MKTNQPPLGRSDYSDVGTFHNKFDLDNTTFKAVGPRDLPQDVIDFRIKFLYEELSEFIEATVTHNEAKMADALIDLVYVAMGTAHLKGFPWPELWNEVQRANMEKERAYGSQDRRSLRHHDFDVVKPHGWKAPDIVGVLQRFGWKL